MSKKTKKSISKRLCDTFDIPVGTFGNISFMEAVSNRELSISGCEYLVTYTEELVILELCDGRLSVRGTGLELRSFTGGRVTISGVISDIGYGVQECASSDS